MIAVIGPSGEVTSAAASRVKGIGGQVAACVAARVGAAQFAPPAGGSATITIPIDFSLVPLPPP